MAPAGLKTIILLSFVLALSFLLIILSCALYSWLSLITATIFALSPLPNFLASALSSPDDFSSSEYSSAPADFGHFVTAVMLVSGVGLPVALVHSGVIPGVAGWMSGVGGAVGYATILTYSHFFAFRIEEY